MENNNAIVKFFTYSLIIIALFTLMPENAYASFNLGDFRNWFGGGGDSGGSTSVPEFGLGAAAAAGAVLIGGISVLFSRRRKK